MKEVLPSPTQTEQEWYDTVVLICKDRGYGEWFYADREAWLDSYREEHYTPKQAVDYNVECLL